MDEAKRATMRDAVIFAWRRSGYTHDVARRLVLRLLFLVNFQVFHHLVRSFGAYEAKGAIVGFGEREKGQASVPDGLLVENGIAAWAGMSKFDAAATVRKPVERVCGNGCLLNEAGGGYSSLRCIQQG